MKATLQAVLKLSGMNIPEKITKGDYMNKQWLLHGKLFPDTAPSTIAARTEVVQRLSTTHATALDGGKLARAEEKAALLEFDALYGAFRDWANQPDVSMGDEVRITQLGFDTSRQEPRRAEKMAAPDLQPLSGTTEGELVAACLPMADARAYLCFVAYGEEMPADDAYQYCTASTKARATLTLTSGKMAWVRMLAVGPKGTTPFSTTQKRRVL